MTIRAVPAAIAEGTALLRVPVIGVAHAVIPHCRRSGPLWDCVSQHTRPRAGDMI
jgi:hypothetical protein